MEPILCTLAPDRMRGRLAFIDRLTEDALLDQRPIPDGLRARFCDAPDVERRVRALVAAESACCAFLRFAIGHDEDALVLDVTGPPEAGPTIAQLLGGAEQ